MNKTEDAFINVAIIENTIEAQLITSIILIYYHEDHNVGDNNKTKAIF